MTPDRERPELVLRREGLSIPRWYLLVACSYGPKPSGAMLADAQAESVGNLFGDLTDGEAQQALDQCMSSRLVQICDARRWPTLRQRLKEQHLIGPIYGFPMEGDVDFTEPGSALFRRVYAEVFGEQHGDGDVFVVDSRPGCRHYYCTALRPLAEEMQALHVTSAVQSVSGPTPIGPWCVFWWEAFREGYRVDVVSPPCER